MASFGTPAHSEEIIPHKLDVIIALAVNMIHPIVVLASPKVDAGIDQVS